MDHATLKRLAPLLGAWLERKRVTRIAAAGPSAVVLHLGREDRLLLSFDAARPGAFPVPRGTVLPACESPLSGAMEARLAGAAVTGVALPLAGDRVMEISFSAPWPRKGEGPRLVLEAMGRRSNLLLLDPRGRVLASGKTLSPSGNPRRPMGLGSLYLPPPQPGPPLPGGGEGNTDRPASVVPLPEGDGGSDLRAVLDSMARAAWSWRAERSASPPNTPAVAPLTDPLRRLKERLARELAHLREEEERCQNFGKVRLEGETLLLHLSRVPPGARRAHLPHPRDPATTLDIKLDPSLSPQENARKRFDLARRLERGLAGLGSRKRKAADALGAAGEAAQALERGDEAPARAILGKGAPRPGGSGKGPELRLTRGWPGPGRRHEMDGFTILVGRGAVDNDRVTFEAAGPGDLWLHARDYPSSHVVVLSGGKAVPEEVVRHAAALCAGKSGARKESAVEVMVAERKWVRKVKGAKPGLVTVSRSRTVLARRRKGEDWP